MEPDRYKNNHKLYIVGIICLVASLSLGFLSIYIGPYLIWQLDYNVPDLVIYLIALFNESYNFSMMQSKLFTWLIFVIPAVITGFISYFTTNRIENRIYYAEPEESEGEKKAHALEVRKQIGESAGIGFKIIILMFVILVLFLLLQGVMQITATSV